LRKDLIQTTVIFVPQTHLFDPNVQSKTLISS